MRITPFLSALALAGLVILTGGPSQGQAPRSGGWLTLRLREDLPQGFAIHESATISTMWPAMPCFSNLVLFDPLKPTHSVDTIVGELAERSGVSIMRKRMPPTLAAGWSSPHSARGASPSRSPEGLISGPSARSPGPIGRRSLK